MSDTTNTASPSALQYFEDALEDSGKLDVILRNLIGTLEKRGLQLSPDVELPIQQIRQNLVRAQREYEMVIDQLDQLQNLVRNSALITSSLHLDQVLEQVVDNVIHLTDAERAYLMLKERDSDILSI